jgi:cytochrome c oxidase subunit II
MKRRSKSLLVFAAFAVGLVALLYIALTITVFHNDDKELTTLSPKGPTAASIQTLNIWVFGAAALVFVLVFAAGFFIMWRFRDTDPDDDEDFPEQVHGRTALEIGWTIAPAVLLAAVAVATVLVIIDQNKFSSDALSVKVEGQQWWWRFHYDLDDDGAFDGPNDLTTATELIVPVDREVNLHITSNDVIHSFWIPALNGKKDAVPGMNTDWKLEASEPGVFRGQCTEYCGLSHANMRMLVRALPTADYDRWLENQLQPPDEPLAGAEAAEGKTQFGNLCATCHVVNGQFEKAAVEEPPLVSGVAPNLTHLMTRGTFAGSIFNLWSPDPPTETDPTGNAGDRAAAGDPTGALYGGEGTNYFNRPALEAWLRDPPAVKPMAAGQERGMPNLGLSEDQIDQLVAYLQTLK